MILITGATGHIGRRIAELLSAHGLELRLMVRNPHQAPQLPGAQAVAGDYSDSITLDLAFAGVHSAFIVSGYAEPGKRALLHRNAFEAAARARIKHLVYLSFQGASPASKFPMSRDHYLSEQYLQECGVPFTALRDSLYMDLIPEMFDEKGVMRGPAGQGAVAWVAREDVARVAAAVLNSDEVSNSIYDVTGPEALTLFETTKRLSVLVNHELRYENESVEQGRKWRSQLEAPTWEVETWLGSYEAIAAGELDQTSDAVMRFTNRQPSSLEDYFAERSHLLAGLTSGKI